MRRYHAPDYQSRRFKPEDLVLHRDGWPAVVIRSTKRGKVTLRIDGARIATAHQSMLNHQIDRALDKVKG